MAAVNVNTVLKRALNGGIVTATDATNTYTIANIEDGELNFTPVMRDAIEYHDRGVQQQPLEGNDQFGEFSLEVNCGQLTGANSLFAALTQAGSSGLVFQFTNFIIDIPTNRGAATGERVTLTSVYISRTPPPTFSKGSRLDTLKFSGKYRSHSVASY